MQPAQEREALAGETPGDEPRETSSARWGPTALCAVFAALLICVWFFLGPDQYAAFVLACCLMLASLVLAHRAPDGGAPALTSLAGIGAGLAVALAFRLAGALPFLPFLDEITRDVRKLLGVNAISIGQPLFLFAWGYAALVSLMTLARKKALAPDLGRENGNLVFAALLLFFSGLSLEGVTRFALRQYPMAALVSPWASLAIALALVAPGLLLFWAMRRRNRQNGREQAALCCGLLLMHACVLAIVQFERKYMATGAVTLWLGYANFALLAGASLALFWRAAVVGKTQDFLTLAAASAGLYAPLVAWRLMSFSKDPNCWYYFASIGRSALVCLAAGLLQGALLWLWRARSQWALPLLNFARTKRGLALFLGWAALTVYFAVMKEHKLELFLASCGALPLLLLALMGLIAGESGRRLQRLSLLGLSAVFLFWATQKWSDYPFSFLEWIGFLNSLCLSIAAAACFIARTRAGEAPAPGRWTWAGWRRISAAGVAGGFAFGLLLLMTLAVLGNVGPTVALQLAEKIGVRVPIERFITVAMRDRYFWRDMVDTQALAASPAPTDPSELLERLKYSARDRWSFILKAEEREDFNQGAYQGLGCVMSWLERDEGTTLLLTDVYEKSPAWKAGLRRGDKVLGIGSHDQAAIINLWKEGSFWREFHTLRMTTQVYVVEKRDGERRSVEITPGRVDIPALPVLTAAGVEGFVLGYFDVGDRQRRVGYFRLTTFREKAFSALDRIFDHLRRDGAAELVIDLRQNGGGLLRAAQHLASLILGPTYAGKVFVEDHLNDRYRERSAMVLDDLPQALGLRRLFVLTSKDTCSASELLVNSLRPYIPVILIGDTTCGKPVGMNQTLYGGYELRCINFEARNARGEGGYYGGIAPQCSVKDDEHFDYGDPAEPGLKESLYYVEHGACRPKVATRGPAPLYVRELAPMEGARAEIRGF